MAISDHFHDRCTIQRSTPGRGTSGEVTKVWSDHLTTIWCRLVVQDERVASPQGLLVATTYRLLVGPNLDITAADQVSQVVLDDLSVHGPFTIESVVPRRGGIGQHHVTLRLEKII